MAHPAESGAAVSHADGTGQAPEQVLAGTSAVVVGVDGSDCSREAIVLAAREARYRDAPLIAVQAYSGERTLAGQPAHPAETLRTPVEDERVQVESSLRDALREALGDLADGVEVRAVLGLAGRRIVETAHKVNAQLIVLATRGSTSMLLGTVSLYVLRKAPCPVLVVPSGPAAAQSVTP
jgi:nucleotide-binding universal stress UspA family protein